MTRTHVVTLTGLVAALSMTAGGYAAEQIEQPSTHLHPRFTMPDGGHPGWIDLPQYLEMENPVEAGRLLLKESIAVGMDIDDSSQVWEQHERFVFGKGTVTAQEAYAFMRAVRVSSPGDSAERVAYLVYFRRSPTIREMSAAMMQDIYFCANALKNRPDIMAARPTHVPAIMSLPYVRWLCPLQPELKYDPELLSGSDSVKLSVRPLVGAHDYCRRDLDRCGARSQYQWVTYLATMPAESVRCVASLWWVLGIERYSEPIED